MQQVALIASNTDNVSAAGSLVPAVYTVVKGVQIAAVLGPVSIVDGVLNRQSNPTTGLTLSAVYDSTSKSFELAIRLSVPQTMSMKSGASILDPFLLSLRYRPLL